jgi:hypothetical protein
MANLHRVRVGVDPDAAAAQQRETAADPAADLQHPAATDTAQIPTVRRLHMQEPLPPRHLQFDEQGCVLGGILPGHQRENPRRSP